MIEIINNVTEFPKSRLNDRVIYFTNIVVSIEITKYQTKDKKKYRHFEYETRELKGKCYEIKPSRINDLYFHNSIRKELDLKKDENIDYMKIILLKELGCSVYKK